jgi:pilus assembly protein CpaC
MTRKRVLALSLALAGMFGLGSYLGSGQGPAFKVAWPTPASELQTQVSVDESFGDAETARPQVKTFHDSERQASPSARRARTTLASEPEHHEDSIVAVEKTAWKKVADPPEAPAKIDAPSQTSARKNATTSQAPRGSSSTITLEPVPPETSPRKVVPARLVSAAETMKPGRRKVDERLRLAQVRNEADQRQLDDLPPAIKEDQEDKRRALARFIDEIDMDRFDRSQIFELYVGLPRLIQFEYQPVRVQLGDEQLVSGTFLTPREYSIVGKRLGSSVLNVWFADDPKTPEDESKLVHSFLLRVVSNPELRKILEARYKEIEDEINRVFPDSRVQLTLVGNKLVLSGECRDIQEATYILGVVRSNVLPGDQVGSGGALAGTGTAATNVAPTTAIGPGGFASGTPGLLNAGLFGGDFIVNLLRIPGEQQIMLRVVVAEVNRSAVRSIGMNFAVQNGAGTIVASNSTGSLLLNGTNAAGGGGSGSSLLGGIGTGSNNINASLDNGQVFLAFSALRTLGYARSLAEPNIVALNGQPAIFQAGGEFPIPIISGFTAAGLQGVSFVPFGVIVQFTPLITDRDRVRLAVRADVSTRDVGIETQIAGATVPGLQTRNFATVVELREGQTLAVAGLIQNNLGANSSRIPGIGDLPFIGNFASFSQISHAEQELVILVTPELVHPLDSKVGHENLPLPGADIYEPGDLEFYVKGRLESRRSTDYRSPVRSEWDRMVAYRRCEQNYIDGPHGQTLQWQRPPQLQPTGPDTRMQYAAPPEGPTGPTSAPMLPPPPEGPSVFSGRAPVPDLNQSSPRQAPGRPAPGNPPSAPAGAAPNPSTGTPLGTRSTSSLSSIPLPSLYR